MKILNIHGQEMPHADAVIVGNSEGLIELKRLIDKALYNNAKRAASRSDKDCLFASDGEGYTITVECHDDQWGVNSPADSFWRKPESDPGYTAMKGEGQ